MLRGLANVSFWADDLEAARRWYVELLGVEPYFVRPEEGPAQYVEFRVGDDQDELGLIDRRFAPPGGAGAPGGVVAYWHVDDVAAARDRLLSMGASEHQPLVVREAGFVTAAVVDPFGNVIGLMHSPHWLALAEARGAGER